MHLESKPSTQVQTCKRIVPVTVTFPHLWVKYVSIYSRGVYMIGICKQCLFYGCKGVRRLAIKGQVIPSIVL